MQSGLLYNVASSFHVVTSHTLTDIHTFARGGDYQSYAMIKGGAVGIPSNSHATDSRCLKGSKFGKTDGWHMEAICHCKSIGCLLGT